MTNKNDVHFVGVAGLRGCLPNCCDVYETFDDAVGDLCRIHDLPPYSKFRKELKDTGFVYLDPYTHGNEYAEINECDCDTLWIHSDSLGPNEVF